MSSQPHLEVVAAAPEPGLIPRPPETPPPDDFQPELTAQQQQVLDLLGMSPSAYTQQA